MVIADEVLSHSQPNVAAHPRGAEPGTVAVLEWKAWDGFLLAHVLGDAALRIETDPFRAFTPEQFERVCQATTVCFQINLSFRRQLPLAIRDLARRFAERGLYVVNGLVQDIRKSTLHKHLEAIGLRSAKAEPSGSPDELLMLKTDLNFGGELEKRLPSEVVATAGFEDLISNDIEGAFQYKVLERASLPKSAWTDPAVVVEKYFANAEDSFYRVYFSGEQVIIVKAFAIGAIKKISHDPRDTNYVSELSFLKAGDDGLRISQKLKQDVATFVEQTPVEFGCIDIVHDGHDEYYIIDLNLTPYAGHDSMDPQLNHFLQMGITNPDQRKPAASICTPLA